MDKVVRDGLVAVIVSPGYGGGWSSWIDGGDRAVFCPEVVRWIEEGKPTHDVRDFEEDLFPIAVYPDYLASVLNENNWFSGVLRQVVIEWLPEGTKFRIDEHDGYERLVLADEEDWFVA